MTKRALTMPPSGSEKVPDSVMSVLPIVGVPSIAWPATQASVYVSGVVSRLVGVLGYVLKSVDSVAVATSNFFHA